MTDPQPTSLTPDELDLLADYLADALEPHAAALVGHDVRTDPRWAAAYEDLLRADALVRSQLAAVAELAEPMPADVAARLDAALAAAAADGRADRAAAAVEDVPDDRGAPARPRVVAGSRAPRQRGTRRDVGGPDRTGPARRRRWPRVAVGVAAAVIALAWGGTAILQQTSTTVTMDSAINDEAAAPPRADVTQQSQPGAGGPPVLATGTNYTPQTLAALGRTTLASGSAVQDDGGGSGPPAGVLASPGPFAKVATVAGLSACLKRVLADHPGTVVLIDYASYEDVPALVIVVRQTSGTVAIVSGTDCGSGSADIRAAVTVA